MKNARFRIVVRTKSLQIFIILFLGAFLSSMAQAAAFVVTKTADTSDGVCNADCSLREAIAAANAAATDDVINFDAAVFGSAQTINLTGAGPLQINNNGTLTINGTGTNLLTIRRAPGGTTNGVFVVMLATAGISGVTITGGVTDTNGGGISNIGGTLTLTNSLVVGNLVGGFGGGVYNAFSGTTNINNSNIFGNQSNPGSGGGTTPPSSLM